MIIKRYRWTRYVIVIILVCSGFYVHKLYNDNIITENIKSYLENMVFAVFFLTDLVVSLISKETFAYYYGADKENMPKLYKFWIGFDIFMIVVMVSLTIRRYFGM